MVIAAVLSCAITQAGYGLWTHRQHIDLRLAGPIGLAQWVAMPLGLWTMRLLVTDRPQLIRQLVGVLILLAVIARFVIRPRPRAAVAPALGYLSGLASGFLAALVGMGGPPQAFFALAHDWTVAKLRTYLWTQFALSAPVLLVLLLLRWKSSALEGFEVGLLSTPLVWLGSWIGLRLTRSWNRASLERAALLLLLAIGISAVGAPLVS
jgi:uncharacterized membrane protein YfcA